MNKKIQQIIDKVNASKGSRTITYKRHGIAVKDAHYGLKIHVLPEDIQAAICRDHQKCVIALAVKRQRNADWVDVGAEIVLIGESGQKATRYWLSKPARRQVQYFDTHDGRFAPCRVDLLPPPPCERLGYDITRIRKRNPNLVRRHMKRRPPTR